MCSGVIDTSRHVQQPVCRRREKLAKCFFWSSFVHTTTRSETFWLQVCNTLWIEQALQGLDFCQNCTKLHSEKGQQPLLLDSADILINILTFSSAQTIAWLDKYNLCQVVEESLMPR